MTSTPSPTKAGTGIRYMREAQGLTQTELAKLAGTTQPYLSQVENGDKAPSADWLHKVQCALAANLLRNRSAS